MSRLRARSCVLHTVRANLACEIACRGGGADSVGALVLTRVALSFGRQRKHAAQSRAHTHRSSRMDKFIELPASGVKQWVGLAVAVVVIIAIAKRAPVVSKFV